MIVRQAEFTDIPDLVALCEMARAASCYSVLTRVNDELLKEKLFIAISGQAGAGPGSFRVFVAVDGDRIDGVIVLHSTWLYEALTVPMVFDLLFFVRPKGNALAAKRLLVAATEWVDSMPGVVVQRHGVTDFVGDPKRTEKLMARAGLRPVGAICERVKT